MTYNSHNHVIHPFKAHSSVPFGKFLNYGKIRNKVCHCNGFKNYAVQ